MKAFHLAMSAILLKMKMPLPWHLDVLIRMKYRFHDPQRLIIVLSALELLVKDDVFAGQLERRR